MKLLTESYPHQIEAADKLAVVKVGALYMEMGTGKTRTALDLIQRRLLAAKIDKVIWFCPCSIKQDIQRNIMFHSDGTDGLIEFFGLESVSQSTRIYAQILNVVQTHNVFLVVDESSMVKNYWALRTQRITAIAELCRYRLLLSGTPVSRTEADLFAQWYILDWRILGYKSFWSFSANHLEFDEYGKIRRTLNVDYLSDKIAPYSYSIKKDECLTLPPKKYQSEYFRLNYEQECHYEEIKETLLDNVDDFKPETIYRLFTALQLITSGRRINACFPALVSEPFFKHSQENPRVIKLLNTVECCRDKKIIVWCKYHHEIQEVVDALRARQTDKTILEYHGKLSIKARNSQLEEFSRDADILVANKSCGGYGLNLQYCHQVIYYSNDFDWATRAQSEDRTHRIGQVHPVLIRDIIASSKVDGRIMSNLERKGNLAESFKREMKTRRDIRAWIDGEDR